jgi:hypothetical protein
VIDAVAQLDLAAFYAAYRADGHGSVAVINNPHTAFAGPS